MGASHTTDYTKSLQFVQNLTDDNFGDLDIFRNNEGKVIMKCIKSFITGDKRHSDFRKVLQFMRTTTNKNVIPLLYLEQYHESNVCIEYEKVQIYTEYLNFSLGGFIENKKSIEEGQIWYLMKSMIQLIVELERNNLKIMLETDNIFLTLKGIPSVFMYHFLANDNNEMPGFDGYQKHFNLSNGNQESYYLSRENKNVQKQNCPDEASCYEGEQDQNNSAQTEIVLKPYCMYFNLGKIILQIFNMQIISSQSHQEEIQIIKNQLFQTLKNNPLLGKIVKQLLTNSNGQEPLSQINNLITSKQIKVSTEIRFNKFRYVIADEQKPRASKNLALNDKNLAQFRSNPVSAATTPIYRLRQNDKSEFEENKLGMKSNLLMSEHNFFKKKMAESKRDLMIENKNKFLSQKQEQKSMRQQGRTKAYSIGGKGKQNTPQQRLSNCEKPHSNHQSKLTLISKRNLSSSKIQRGVDISTNSFSSVSNNEGKKHLMQSHARQAQLTNNNTNFESLNSTHKLSYQLQNIPKLKENREKELRSTNRIQEILNQELKGKCLRSNGQFTSLSKSNLISNNKSSQNNSLLISKNIPQKTKSFFIQHQDLKQNDTLAYQTSQYKDKSIINSQKSQFQYKNHATEYQNQSDQSEYQQQKVKPLLPLSNQKPSKMTSSINTLDKQNFLSTLEMKKNRNNIKTKQASEKKDLILSIFPIKKDSKTFQHNVSYQKQHLIQQQQKQKQHNLIRQKTGLKQIDTSTNFQSNKVTTTLDKKKIKLRSEKNESINRRQLQIQIQQARENQRQDENKENRASNTEEMMRNSKLRRVSIRAKGQTIV